VAQYVAQTDGRRVLMDVKKLYTDKLDSYVSFSSFFRYSGLEAFFESWE
jgi:hypothetical protein